MSADTITTNNTATIAYAEQRIAWLEARLECYATDQSGNKVAVPDGIECRDETIKSLDAKADALTTSLASERMHKGALIERVAVLEGALESGLRQLRLVGITDGAAVAEMSAALAAVEAK